MFDTADVLSQVQQTKDGAATVEEGYQSKGNGWAEANFNTGCLLVPVVILYAVLVFKQIAYVMYIKTWQWNQHSISLKRTVPFVAT